MNAPAQMTGGLLLLLGLAGAGMSVFSDTVIATLPALQVALAANDRDVQQLVSLFFLATALMALVVGALAAHGGGAVLIDFKDGIADLELTGGCQGCSMASATLKNGVEASIRERFPEVQEVRDVTQHARGSNPYFH